MESVRKPGTECIYGRMKKRFRILAIPCSFDCESKMDNCFRFLVMLHNRNQRHFGLDTLGDEEADWKAANTHLDDERIAREVGGAALGVPHYVDDRAVGNDTEAEFEASWASLRAALVTHFRIMWERKEVKWLKPATECRPNYRTDPGIRRTGRAEADEV